MKNRIVNYHTFQFGREWHNPVAEITVKPSKTVPDQALSMSELLKRFVRGDNVTTFEPVYYGENPVPDFDRMDATTRMEYAKDIERSIGQARKPRPKQVIDVNPEPVTDVPPGRVEPE